MSRTEIINQLTEVYTLISPNSDTTNLNENSNLRTDLGLASIGMLYLIIAVEQKFNVKFEDVSMTDFETIKDVIDYIEKKVN